LIELVETISIEINQAMVGRGEEVLVEGPSRRSNQMLMGRTRGDKVVVFAGPGDLVGRTIELKIVRAAAHTLFGNAERHGS